MITSDPFTTRKAVSIYLLKKDWRFAGLNMGEWTFAKKHSATVCIIVRMKNGTWEIACYGREMLHPACGFKKAKTPVHANPIFHALNS